MNIDERRNDLLDDIKENISVIASNISVSEIEEVFEALCFQFESLGIYGLLTKYDLDDFYRNLILSGFCRRSYLERCKAKGVSESLYHAISRTQSVFSCIVADQVNLAKELISMSSNVWLKDGEYEDDFLYYQFIYKLLISPKNKNELTSILESFEKVLDGDFSSRYSVCKSLLDRNNEAFNEAFTDLIIERENYIDNKVFHNDPMFLAHDFVFIEGLGLLLLARSLGMVVEKDYKYCLDVLITDAKVELPDDIFSAI